jgi:redox-sensing transcriptional repressor
VQSLAKVSKTQALDGGIVVDGSIIQQRYVQAILEYQHYLESTVGNLKVNSERQSHFQATVLPFRTHWVYTGWQALKMKSEKISELTTNRLSIYLRCLNTLSAAGIKSISSQALAQQFNLNSAQIRKDLGYFGEFGVRGVGYRVEDLRQHITKILGLDRPHRVGIVGAGRLGTALANYKGFERSNFSVVALFDNDGSKIGRRVGEEKLVIQDVKKMPRVVSNKSIDVMVIAVPARAAQRVLNQIMSAGIKAVLNFAPAPLGARLGVKVKTVDLTTSLESLSYFLARPPVSAVTNHRNSPRLEELAELAEQDLQ